MPVMEWFRTLTVRQLAVLVLVVGLVLRVVIGLFYTYPIEDNYWILASTNLTAGEGLYGVPGYYYLPVWGYFLALITAFTNFLGIPYGHYVDNIGTIIKDCDIIVPTVEYSMTVLVVLIIFDVLVGYLIYRIGMKVTGDERKSVIMSAIWFLCPLTIAISSIRLMFENVEIFFLLVSVLLLMERKPTAAGMAMGACLPSKQFGVFAALLLLAYSYSQTRDLKYSLKYLGGALISALILMAPVIANGDFETSMHWLTSRVDSGGSGDVFNYSIILTPLMALLTIFLSYRVARHGVKDFATLSLYMLLPVAIMFVIPGNVQYYLFLLPFMIFASAREMRLPYISMGILAALSLLVVIGLCSGIYVESGLPGAGIINGIAEFLEPLEQFDWLYTAFKSLTGLLAAAVAVYLLLIKPRRSNEAYRRRSDRRRRGGHADRDGSGQLSWSVQMPVRGMGGR